MRGHNHINLIGNLTADPEIRFTPSKVKCATFHIAVEERYKAAAGEAQSITTFVPIVAWGKIADICEKHLKKGMRIHMDGKLRINVVKGKNGGGSRWYTSVLMREFLFLDAKPASVVVPAMQETDSFPDEILGEAELDDLSMLENGQYSE